MPVVVGLIADPALPADVAHRLAATLPSVLAARLDSDGADWRVETVVEGFEEHGEGPGVLERARERARDTGWDVTVCLTDVPAVSEGKPVVAELDERARIAVLSLPSLGGFRLFPRTRDAVVDLIGTLTGTARTGDRTVSAVHTELLRSTARTSGEGTELSRTGSLRLLAGTVRANRPWRLALALGAALAGAATGSAFGLLYSNIWSLATALAPWRLVLAYVGAVALFVGWLLLRHRLWERRRASPAPAWLLNTATVLTLTGGTLAFTVVLLVGNSVAAAVILPPDHLGGVLGRAATVADYVRIVVMATLLGVVAGAVGSGLEDSEAVRRVAYGHRRRERRRPGPPE
ncbi:hypothetical protein [Pseudonocardia oroxyli]|uniref:5,10-methylene-tetrahydrofolate dehydrogenase/Methenyl tetrahydrofolate cyclohydrolase n=1 Tax=Pseudonocardia oroxyli TaxID=366584 RepID=A0A1G7WKX7_PSEOR|nr:hypothetical protein [Pseudonocardia oroxyli]SDG72509.1 hypothetical protein SAMN05216377_114161 [Pseudonocardia oroxyli]